MVSDILRENCGFRYPEKEKEGTNPLGVKRTSKHEKKSAVRVEGEIYRHRAGVDEPQPWAVIRDALVGGVNAEHLAHGRNVKEDEGRNGSTCMVKCLG